MTGLVVISYISLWALVIVLSAVTLLLVRQIGFLNRRLPSQGARVSVDGPAVGEPAPELRGSHPSGEQTVFTPDPAKDSLLVFILPGCETCDEIGPALRSISRSERTRIRTWLVSMKDGAEFGDYVARHNLTSLSLIVATRGIFQSFNIVGTPYGVLVGADGKVISKGLVNSFEQIESLLLAKDAPSVLSTEGNGKVGAKGGPESRLVQDQVLSLRQEDPSKDSGGEN